MVVNAPEGNTVTAAEHTIAMMRLARNIPQANATLKKGIWDKKYVGVELRETLGVIGLQIGWEVERRAGIEMQVLDYDPL